MKRTIIIIAVSLGFSTLINAQAGRNARERASDQKQIAVNENQLERDKQELKDFKASVARLEDAWANKDVANVNRIKNTLVVAMNREISQSKAKLGQDRKEIAGSQSELKSERREVRYDRKDVRTPDGDAGDRADLKGDRMDKRDDRRDVADDKRDFMNQAEVLNRQQEIYKTLKAYNFVVEGPSLEKAMANKALLSEFIDTMEADIWFTKTEMGEDKRELREDRRETRDDRRERRERR